MELDESKAQLDLSFSDEIEGRESFYLDFLPRVDSALSTEDVLNDYNDGVVRGNLLEFKLRITDLNQVLFQAVKYLSARRVKGKPVPATIHLISLEDAIDYVYRSEDYRDHIEVVYVGGASKNNSAFLGEKPDFALHYRNSQLDAESLVELLREERWMRINIDENCIVGWAEHFYRICPNASKGDFLGDAQGKVKVIGEIRKPNILSDYILPYAGETNVRFKYLMDQLNDFLHKKDLGAFYTPPEFAEIAVRLLRKAIDRVPSGNDYVIIDRCAGTGNLEQFLTDEELSHCIVSTYEYYEYKVLAERLGDKVRHIVPPFELPDTFFAGMVRGSDALSKSFIDNEVITRYLSDESCSIILFENPPFAETTSMEHQKKRAGKTSSAWKQSYVVGEMRKAIKASGRIAPQALNEMSNAFVWSGFEYYLRQPTDSYVVFSPIKYWKSQFLIDRVLVDGFAVDREKFHARKHSCLVVALWANAESDITQFSVPAFDLSRDGITRRDSSLDFKRVYSKFSDVYYDRRSFPDDVEGGILVQHDGTEAGDQKKRLKPKYSKNILGYMVADGQGFEQPDLHSCLVIAGMYNGNGFYLRADNYLEKLPLFAASRYISYVSDWTERGRIMKSADGATRYQNDINSGKLDSWLKKCLIFTTCEIRNHLRTFVGSDGRFYRNELCLDTTNGETVASLDLKNYSFDERDAELVRAWDLVLSAARDTQGYDDSLTYGLYQIDVELNTRYKDPQTNEMVFDYPELNGHIRSLKALVREYFVSELVPVLFKYEFLK